SVALTWSSSGATSCVASDGWTGTKAAAGSETVAGLNTNSTFVLTCTGPGGARDASVAVTIVAEQRSGGGGRTDWFLLVVVAVVALSSRVRRSASHRSASSLGAAGSVVQATRARCG